VGWRYRAVSSTGEAKSIYFSNTFSCDLFAAIAFRHFLAWFREQNCYRFSLIGSDISQRLGSSAKRGDCYLFIYLFIIIIIISEQLALAVKLGVFIQDQLVIPEKK